MAFKTYKEMSFRRRIQDVQNKNPGESLFAKEFEATNGRPPKDIECMLEVDRLQKLISQGKRR